MSAYPALRQYCTGMAFAQSHSALHLSAGRSVPHLTRAPSISAGQCSCSETESAQVRMLYGWASKWVKQA